MAYKIPAMPLAYQPFSYKSYDELEVNVDISIAGRLRLSILHEERAFVAGLTAHEVRELIWQLKDALREIEGA